MLLIKEHVLEELCLEDYIEKFDFKKFNSVTNILTPSKANSKIKDTGRSCRPELFF